MHVVFSNINLITEYFKASHNDDDVVYDFI